MTDEVQKNKGGRPPGPSRAQLIEERDAAQAKNIALEARMQRLEEGFAKNQETDDQRRLREARAADAAAELALLRPDAAKPLEVPRGPAPKFEPYRGLVRARTDCATDCYHVKGEVFAVDVSVLWSDDPYEAVRQTNTNDLEPLYERASDVPVVDAKFRARVSPDALNPIARAI